MFGARLALALSISHESLGHANNFGHADPASACCFSRTLSRILPRVVYLDC